MVGTFKDMMWISTLHMITYTIVKIKINNLRYYAEKVIQKKLSRNFSQIIDNHFIYLDKITRWVYLYLNKLSMWVSQTRGIGNAKNACNIYILLRFDECVWKERVQLL